MPPSSNWLAMFILSRWLMKEIREDDAFKGAAQGQASAAKESLLCHAWDMSRDQSRHGHPRIGDDLDGRVGGKIGLHAVGIGASIEDGRIAIEIGRGAKAVEDRLSGNDKDVESSVGRGLKDGKFEIEKRTWEGHAGREAGEGIGTKVCEAFKLPHVTIKDEDSIVKAAQRGEMAAAEAKKMHNP
jgi:hypothetical protein